MQWPCNDKLNTLTSQKSPWQSCMERLPVAVEVAVYHTAVVVCITGIAAAVHIAGVVVVV